MWPLVTSQSEKMWPQGVQTSSSADLRLWSVVTMWISLISHLISCVGIWKAITVLKTNRRGRQYTLIGFCQSHMNIIGTWTTIPVSQKAAYSVLCCVDDMTTLQKVVMLKSKQGLKKKTDLAAHQVLIGWNQVIALQVFHHNRLLQSQESVTGRDKSALTTGYYSSGGNAQMKLLFEHRTTKI